MTSDKPLHVLKEINFARFSLQQSLSKYFPFKTLKKDVMKHVSYFESVFDLSENNNYTIIKTDNK